MTLELQPFNPVRPEDDEAVAQFNALRREAMGLHPATKARTPDDEWRSFQTHHANTAEYIAPFEDVPIAVAVRARFIAQGRIADVLSMAVAPEFRSRSLGSQALAQLEDTCRSKRMRTMRVTSLKTAQDFYTKNDYETVGVHQGLVLMRKRLIA